MSRQRHKKFHVSPNMSQARKRLSAVSEQPHPPTIIMLKDTSPQKINFGWDMTPYIEAIDSRHFSYFILSR
ncbi:hypothetical protein MTR_3g093670 [Medicago truncatula]|uniref:Uncharacterized protein n=1 Tax=Medicago truncatula TaxID=3880 RepID=A0A072V0H1_MEDTR|nr:hypothetical protein MTR_3g093670 [Medicago truncatula]